VPLEKALLQFAPADQSALPADVDRTAGVVTVVGCLATFLAALLPWLLQAFLSVSLAAAAIQRAGVVLAVLAVISAGVAAAALFRKAATAGVAMALIALALTQLGLAIWNGAAILQAIEHAGSHQVLINAIGTGAYGGVLGSAITLAGGILAWWRRRE
jgi:hypothetical protein